MRGTAQRYFCSVVRKYSELSWDISFWKGNYRGRGSFRLEKPFEMKLDCKPNPASPALNHGPKHYIYASLKHLQEW